MSDSIEESAKAVQEVAKTTGQAICFTDKACGFMSRVFGRPIEDAADVFVGQPLKFFKAEKELERQLKFIDRWEAKLRERKLLGKTVPVSLKLALPIWQHASFEDDEMLRDIWANLLASAGDPTREEIVRVAFVGIVQQLESIDARLLDVIYGEYLRETASKTANLPMLHRRFSPVEFAIESSALRSRLELSQDAFECAIDNLFRLRCLASYVLTTDTQAYDQNCNAFTRQISADYLYTKLCITPLGIALVKACIRP